MKTIKYFLTSVFTLLLAIASIIYGVSLISTSTTLYTKLGDTTPITFTATFVFTGIILVAIGFLLIIVSYTSFSISRKYYLNYLTNKRDRDIKTSIINEKYRQLYNDLQDSPTIELKEIVINNFYKRTKVSLDILTAYRMSGHKDFVDFIKDMKINN